MHCIGQEKVVLFFTCKDRYVCETFFHKTFCLSDSGVTRALNKVKNKEKSPGEDLRGNAPSSLKLPDDQIQAVKDHIISPLAFQSHYTRQDNPESFLALLWMLEKCTYLA
jgi:hypothetical protein